MVYLEDIMDYELLDQMVNEGYVTAREHNTLPLIILNYTPAAQYAWKWNDVTLKARGLIFNKLTHEVIARPFEKFFNWDQGVGAETWQNPMPPAGPAIRMEKMDGSLGILYWDESDPNESFPCVATRGSFHSEQAEWATKEVREYFPGPEPRDDKTYLFEIIYPENRIVVDYGEYSGLVLLDVIDNETGKSDLQEFDDFEWPEKVSRTILFNGFDSGQAAEIPDGDEGFVYLWPEKNFRTKMKSAEYIELHKLISHLSEKSVWEQLVAGKTIDQIKAGLPDEFYGFVDKTYEQIMENVGRIMQKVAIEFYNLREKFPEYARPQDVPRKDIAQEIVKSDNKKYLFQMLDGKPIYPVALQDSKPKTNKALVSTEDI
jgi:RNA ligase